MQDESNRKRLHKYFRKVPGNEIEMNMPEESSQDLIRAISPLKA